MQVKIFDANVAKKLISQIQRFCDDGVYITNVKFEVFDDQRKLLVYYTSNNESLKQEVVVHNKNINSTISLLNKALNENIACFDTVLFNSNGLMAIIIKDIE